MDNYFSPGPHLIRITANFLRSSYIMMRKLRLIVNKTQTANNDFYRYFILLSLKALKRFESGTHFAQVRGRSQVQRLQDRRYFSAYLLKSHHVCEGLI